MSDMAQEPFVSIIVPCRNEAQHIADVMDCLLSQDYPQERMEILVIDGMSDDATRDKLGRYCRQHSCIRMLDNLKKGIPQAMNIGIQDAKGEVIIRADAHCGYPKDYVSRLIYWQHHLNADNVGGIWITVPGGQTPVALAIAYVLTVPFGIGHALYRIGVAKPTEVDTVPFGCYKRTVFDKIGLFDECMARTEDDEFNARLRKAGGRIYLVPDIHIIYYARETVGKLLRMLFQYGYFKPAVAIKHGGPTSFRQLVPFGFVLTLLLLIGGSFFWPPLGLSLAGIVALHLALGTISSVPLARRRGASCALFAPVVFLLMHLAYGAGYFRGLFDYLVLRSHFAGNGEYVPLSR